MSEHEEPSVLGRLFPPGHHLSRETITPGELLVAQVQAHLCHYNTVSEASKTYKETPSLAAAAADKIVSTLRYDYEDGLEILRKNCPPALLKSLLDNPGLPYTAFRALGNLYDTDSTEVGRKARENIDDWILKNERQVRRAREVELVKGLVVTLEDGDVLWPGSVVEYDGKNTARVITRKDPPRETYAILDERRSRRLRIQPNTQKFAETWDRLTGGVLEGLNWDNVFVAGGMALSTLTCVDPAMDGKYRKSDIDLYIYGLSADEATAKVREIYNVWHKNTGRSFVVRNAKTFTFIGNYPERRVQIILKLVDSPAEVLMNFDLDQCALGWNGKDLLMLPRAARALETGYTIFTTDLIIGHYLSDRRATQETRVFKYADLGFGILFPSCVLKDVEIDLAKRRPHEMSLGSTSWRSYRNDDTMLKPKIVQGKKAMKAVAWLGEDTTRRFYVGKTKMSSVIRHRVYSRDATLSNADAISSNSDQSEDEEFSYDGRDVRSASVVEQEQDEYRQPLVAPWDDNAVTNPKPTGPHGAYVVGSFAYLNGREQHRGQPNGRVGLKMFETFMRMVELWRLECRGFLKIERDSFESTTYANEGYDDLPRYEWNAKFNHDDFAARINGYNQNIFEETKALVRQETDLDRYDSRAGRWTGYFTRQFRRMICAENINELLAKQITLPLYVPPELESYILKTMEDVRALHKLPLTDETRVLIAAHKPANHPQYNVPSIPRPENSDWPLRIWVIGNTTMWAKLDRRLDEIFEVLWTMYHLTFSKGSTSLMPPEPGDDSNHAITELLGALLERRPVPPLPSENVEDDDAERSKLVLKQWLMERPHYVQRAYTQGYASNYEEWYDHLPPLIGKDEWYWNEETDGANDGGVWRDVKEELKKIESVMDKEKEIEGASADKAAAKRKRGDSDSSEPQRMATGPSIESS